GRVAGTGGWGGSRYPAVGVVPAKELPAPARAATYLTRESADVAHSFWTPQLAGKTAVTPNRRNVMWLTPWEPGTYLGQCAEYCGTQHAHMLLRVVAHAPDEFQPPLVSHP